MLKVLGSGPGWLPVQHNRARHKVWGISYIKDGKQHRESTDWTNKKLAERLLTLRTAQVFQVFEERSSLPRSKSPHLGSWVEGFLNPLSHDQTRSRYRSSLNNILSYFGKSVRLSEITLESVFRFQQERLDEGAAGP
jgi:hypothetical protein